MLLTINRYSDINGRMLMDIYAESNLENTVSFYPEIKDKACAVRKIEKDFLNYLENEFFASEGNSLWVLEENGVWVSALRLYALRPGFYYMEALETRPGYRKNGYAVKLLREVINTLKGEGPFKLCSCVSKNNAASLRTHEKCGYEIISEEGYDYLSGESDGRDYGLEYSFSPDSA